MLYNKNISLSPGALFPPVKEREWLLKTAAVSSKTGKGASRRGLSIQES
jgi:hypothetical protein